MASYVLAGVQTSIRPTAIITRADVLLDAIGDRPLMGSAMPADAVKVTTAIAGLVVAIGRLNKVRYPARLLCEGVVYEQPLKETEIGTI